MDNQNNTRYIISMKGFYSDVIIQSYVYFRKEQLADRPMLIDLLYKSFLSKITRVHMKKGITDQRMENLFVNNRDLLRENLLKLSVDDKKILHLEDIGFEIVYSIWDYDKHKVESIESRFLSKKRIRKFNKAEKTIKEQMENLHHKKAA